MKRVQKGKYATFAAVMLATASFALSPMIMPAFVLGNAIAASLMRHMRSSMLQEIQNRESLNIAVEQEEGEDRDSLEHSKLPLTSGIKEKRE